VAVRLSIHFVVASDVEQDNFSLAHTKRQGNAVGMRDTHGMKSFEFSAERMQSKGPQKGIGFEISQDLGEWLFEFRVGSRKLDDYADQNSRSSAAHTSGIETQFVDQRLRRHTAHSPCFHIFQRPSNS
jgi:hypothetical protein